MIDQIYAFFSIEMIYIWLNFGILPFWFILIFFPQTKICKIFVTSIFPIIVLATIDLYLIFEILENGFNFINIFDLYIGLDELINILSDKNYTIIFWVHLNVIQYLSGLLFAKKAKHCQIDRPVNQ